MFVREEKKVVWRRVMVSIQEVADRLNGLIFARDSSNVIVPVAGIIITAVLCYELISMVTANNGFERDGEETAIWVFLYDGQSDTESA